MIELKPEFKIGEKVYYDLPESEPGIVTDITYRLSSNIIWYHVTFDPNRGEVHCQDFELTRERSVI